MTPSVQDTAAPVTSCRVIRRWEVPHDGVKAADGTLAEMQALLNTLPHELGNYLHTTTAIASLTSMRFIFSLASFQSASLQMLRQELL